MGNWLAKHKRLLRKSIGKAGGKEEICLYRKTTGIREEDASSSKDVRLPYPAHNPWSDLKSLSGFTACDLSVGSPREMAGRVCAANTAEGQERGPAWIGEALFVGPQEGAN